MRLDLTVFFPHDHAMSTLSDILEYNQHFVENREYQAFLTDRFPNKKLIIITCMDTRLVELLPKAMNIRNGDVMMIKVAGAVVSHPFGGVMRSILVAIYKLDAQEIAVVGHHGCGMVGLNSKDLLQRTAELGISPEVLHTLNNSGIPLGEWLKGFDRVEDGVLATVNMIRNHPLLPKTLPVHGLVMDPETGKLDLVADGYQPT
jgi:carbonic anhydrase